ncbi:MAG: RNA 2'-phosphotransferase [archaeon]|nr:RNA 2'-phosphotransferase [archaeon]
MGLPIRADGYMRVDLLTDHLANRDRPMLCSLADFQAVTADNDKQRFKLVEEGGVWWIRANQGHSISVPELELTPIELVDCHRFPCVVHGTYLRSWPMIRDSGLSRMQRAHVHLAKGVPGERGVISGMRSSAEVYVYIDLPNALAAGLKFYESLNGVILSPGNAEGVIPPAYFQSVTDQHGHDVV